MVCEALCVIWFVRKMDKPLISLVIPVYNAEKHLKECLDSVCAALRPGCEVVLVDDGSTDASCKLIEDKYSSMLDGEDFNLIKISNSGPGQARNVGVSASNGRYVGFLDSDDVIHDRYFDSILPILEAGEIDIVQFNLLRFDGADPYNGEIIVSHHSPSGDYQLKDVREDIFCVGKWFPCTRVFRRELIQEFPFPSEKVFYEDLVTIPLVFIQDCAIALLDSALVSYRDNPDGTTRNHSFAHAWTIYDFLLDVSSRRDIPEVDILSIKLARTVLFFRFELGIKEIKIADVLGIVKSVRNRNKGIEGLGRYDRLLYRFPYFYAILDWVRHRLRLVSK